MFLEKLWLCQADSTDRSKRETDMLRECEQEDKDPSADKGHGGWRTAGQEV